MLGSSRDMIATSQTVDNSQHPDYSLSACTASPEKGGSASPGLGATQGMERRAQQAWTRVGTDEMSVWMLHENDLVDTKESGQPRQAAKGGGMGVRAET